MKGWQKVYSSTNAYQAEIVKDVLEDRGLSPVLINKKDSSLNNFGSYEIHISPDHVLEALKIVENDINFK
ncbi:MAG: DUF2007 domain-containing protein [Fulvivirga sp.]|nr:DUF2007 domain-containing protein [Fulvivirga sp.]